MSGSFFNRFNTDDVFFRNCILGLLDVMNKKLSIWNRISEDNIEIVHVPFFYSMAGDERFMQDIFLQDSLDDCKVDKTTEGNVNIIPSGIISVSSISFDTARMSNRFVRGEYKRNIDGEIKTFNSMQNQVPVNVNIDCEITMDSQLDMFKMVEMLIKTFYKTHIYEIVFNGSTIRAQVGFPEEYSHDKPTEFSFGDMIQPKITFTLEIETYYPIPDPTQVFEKSNSINSFTLNTNDTIFNTNSENIPSDAKNFLQI